MNSLMGNLCRIFMYPFVFWCAVSLGVLALTGSPHCVNPVVGLREQEREGAGKEQIS